MYLRLKMHSERIPCSLLQGASIPLVDSCTVTLLDPEPVHMGICDEVSKDRGFALASKTFPGLQEATRWVIDRYGL
jgi:hypothetical protein